MTDKNLENVPANVSHSAGSTDNKKLMQVLAEQRGVTPAQLMSSLKKVAFKADVTDEQMMALMFVADKYKLDPFLKELYAFPDKGGSIVPIVSIDGWSRLINDHPKTINLTYVYSDETVEKNGKHAPVWIECKISRIDRDEPCVVREYLDECYRETGPWKSHPSRMLRHKATIQCARMALGYTGLKDEDEAERIRDVTPQKPKNDEQAADLEAALRKNKNTDAVDVDEVVDVDTGEIIEHNASMNGSVDADESHPAVN